MNNITIRKEHKRKHSIKDKEWNQSDVEQRPLIEQIAQFGIYHNEGGSARHNGIQFEEGNGLSTTVAHYQCILGITYGGEDIYEEEHHEGH